MSTATAGRRAGAAACLAFLVGATVVGWRVASGNFAVVDRAKNPAIDRVFADLQGDETRTLATRYIVNESNRSLFRFSAPVAMACLLAALFLFLSAARREPHPRDRLIRWLLLGVLVLGTATALSVPWFVAQGRKNDFVSRADGDPPAVRTWKRRHGAYMAANLLEVLGAAALVPLLIGTLRRPAA